MGKRAERHQAIRAFVLGEVRKHPASLARAVAERFHVSRQAANKHLSAMVAGGLLHAQGRTSARSYSLALQSDWTVALRLEDAKSEDNVWRHHVDEHLKNLSPNAQPIWHYGFTKMFNNVIDHSASETVTISITRDAARTTMRIKDAGIGIFKKIVDACGLEDERHAVLELAKGKLTTDPERHTGEGIFFSSRIFDDYWIFSGDTAFSHNSDQEEDWILSTQAPWPGTTVVMALDNDTKRTTKEVFDQFAPGDEYGFTKTVVPVRLAQYGDALLVSRSQAKRLLVRVDRFETVLFDFEGVADIGQAFADEIFRVFANQHASMKLLPINASKQVERMISRARAHT